MSIVETALKGAAHLQLFLYLLFLHSVCNVYNDTYKASARPNEIENITGECDCPRIECQLHRLLLIILPILWIKHFQVFQQDFFLKVHR